jgi:hypothetical protein
VTSPLTDDRTDRSTWLEVAGGWEAVVVIGAAVVVVCGEGVEAAAGDLPPHPASRRSSAASRKATGTFNILPIKPPAGRGMWKRAIFDIIISREVNITIDFLRLQPLL